MGNDHASAAAAPPAFSCQRGDHLEEAYQDVNDVIKQNWRAAVIDPFKPK